MASADDVRAELKKLLNALSVGPWRKVAPDLIRAPSVSDMPRDPAIYEAAVTRIRAYRSNLERSRKARKVVSHG